MRQFIHVQFLKFYCFLSNLAKLSQDQLTHRPVSYKNDYYFKPLNFGVGCGFAALFIARETNTGTYLPGISKVLSDRIRAQDYFRR